MSIVFLVRSMGGGGAERQLLALARGLHRRGHSILIVTIYREGIFLRELSSSGVPVHHLCRRGRWDLPRTLWRLISLVRRTRPDVLHGYTVVPNIFALLMRSFLPKHASIVWGVRESSIDFNRYSWLAFLAFRISCRLSRFADRIIANSWAGSAHHCLHGYPEEKMTVIPNGIDTDRFKPDTEGGARVRAHWGIEPGTRLIGLVARLDPMKDHETFLRAAALLGGSPTDLRFVCVGYGTPEQISTFRARSDELGLGNQIIWSGPRLDMTAVYSSFDVCCSSSYGEGFSNVIGEAMACGVPCVVTDVGDSARIVGSTGIVVPAGNPERLAEGLRAMLERLRTRRDNGCRQFIVENFSLERLLSASEDVFRDAAH